MKLILSAVAAVVVATGVLRSASVSAVAPAPGACAGMASLKLPDTTIKSFEEVPGPTFRSSDDGVINNLPAFCRVVAVTKPAVTVEVWLPLANGNGKFQGVGNGGTAGVISYGALATAIRRGYAAASTDTGHVSKDSADSSWAIGRPDLVADFGHRGTHIMSENGKA